MADGLASLLASGYPTLPAETQALTAENALAVAQDPSRWQGQGIFGGLARQMALGQAQGQLQSAVPQIVAAHNAALPDLAAAYAAPDPYQWAANNPDASPLARAMVLSSSPLQVAQVRNFAADAQYRQALAAYQRWQMTGMGNPPPVVPPGGGGSSGAAAGANAASPVPGYTPGSMGSGHGSSLAIDPTNVPPNQLRAYLARLNPAQRTQALALIRARAAAPPLVPTPNPAPTISGGAAPSP